MNGPDSEGYQAAMQLEWEQLENKDTWDIVPRKEALDKGVRLVASYEYCYLLARIYRDDL